MLNKNQSNKRNSWKYAVVLPLLGAFLFFFQVKVVAQEKTAPKQETETKTETIDLTKFKIEKDLITLSKGKEIYINGEKSTENELAKLDPKEIERIDVAKVNNKESILITPKRLIKPVRITDKDIYIDGVKSTNEDFNKLDQSTVDKVDVNTFENTVRITTKKETKVAEIDKFEIIITKNTTDEEIQEKCQQLNNKLNIGLTFFNIERNSNGEIIHIESIYEKDFSHTVKKSFSIGKEKPIESFRFHYEKKGDFTVGGYGFLGNIISRIIDNKSIDYKKAVILIDGEQSDYQTLEKVNPKEVKRVVTKDINNRWPENKKYFELYGEKALYGILISLQTKNYYDKNN